MSDEKKDAVVPANGNGKVKRTKASIAKESVNWAALAAALTMALTTWSDNNTINDNQAKLENQADKTAELATVLAADNTADQMYEQIRPVIESMRSLDEAQDRRIARMETRIDMLMMSGSGHPMLAMTEGPPECMTDDDCQVGDACVSEVCEKSCEQQCFERNLHRAVSPEAIVGDCRMECDSFEADVDDDGIINGNDKCPNKPETYNGFADGDGCPDSKPVAAKTPSSRPTALPERLDDALPPEVKKARADRKKLVEQVQMQAQENLHPTQGL